MPTFLKYWGVMGIVQGVVAVRLSMGTSFKLCAGALPSPSLIHSIDS